MANAHAVLQGGKEWVRAKVEHLYNKISHEKGPHRMPMRPFGWALAGDAYSSSGGQVGARSVTVTGLMP